MSSTGLTQVDDNAFDVVESSWGRDGFDEKRSTLRLLQSALIGKIPGTKASTLDSGFNVGG